MVRPEFFVNTLKEHQIDFYAGVPDSLLKNICAYITDNLPAEQNIIAANENINVCSALYSPLMVKDAVDEAVALLKGETVDPVKVIPTTIVDRSNVDQYLDPENTVY